MGQAVRAETRRDAYDVVRQFLNDLRDGKTSLKRVGEIEEDLYTVMKRLERVRSLGPEFRDVSVGEDVQQLLKLVGRRKKILGFPLLRKAAALL